MIQNGGQDPGNDRKIADGKMSAFSQKILYWLSLL